LEKEKKVAWFASNCFTSNRRKDFATDLANFIPVEIFGHCGNLVCSRLDPKCFQILRNDYKFYLAFENANCRNYITEKFFVNALQNDILPIVMGAPRADYEAVAPPNSFIHVDDFSKTEDLAKFLLELDANDTLYNQYFEWKKTGGEFINTKFWCRLCTMLNEPKEKNYEDLEKMVAGTKNLFKRWMEKQFCILKSFHSFQNYSSKIILRLEIFSFLFFPLVFLAGNL